MHAARSLNPNGKSKARLEELRKKHGIGKVYQENQKDSEKPLNNELTDLSLLKLSQEDMDGKKKGLKNNMDKARIDLFYQAKEEQWQIRMKKLEAAEKKVKADREMLRVHQPAVHERNGMKDRKDRDHEFQLRENEIEIKIQEMEKKQDSFQIRERGMISKEQALAVEKYRLNEENKLFIKRSELVDMKEKEVLALRKVVDHERDALDEQRNEFQITCENFEDEKDQLFQSFTAEKKTKLNEIKQQEECVEERETSLKIREENVTNIEHTNVQQKRALEDLSRQLEEREYTLSIAEKKVQAKLTDAQNREEHLNNLEQKLKLRERQGQVFAADVEAQHQMNLEKERHLEKNPSKDSLTIVKPKQTLKTSKETAPAVVKKGGKLRFKQKRSK